MDNYMNQQICVPNNGCVYRQAKEIEPGIWGFIYVKENELKSKKDELCFFCRKEAKTDNKI